MYGDILRGIEGIGIFPIISLVLFVAVFSAVLVWAVRADRARLDRHAALPLDAPVQGAPVDSRSAGAADQSLRAALRLTSARSADRSLRARRME